MGKLTKAAVPIGVVSIVLMLVVPLPAAVLDLLLGFNITASLLILLVSMQIKRPLDFSIFPSLVLIATLMRLALNVSSTRLVLTDGYAGKVIEAFGHFVIGGSLIVGLVIFVILTIIQFVVITNGAGRVAEVGARFTLDAMPGKQMAIDADLNAGLINEKQARQRRMEVTAEADFYGSMDGASKFVKGDAIAAIIVTLINLIGGFAIGVMQKGMAPADAVSTYSLLTVGDGLVSQIPALLHLGRHRPDRDPLAAEGDMGSDLLAQLGRNKQPVRIAGVAALALCLIPGLPKLPFLLVGGLFLFWPPDDRRGRRGGRRAAGAAAAAAEPQPDSPEAIAEQDARRPAGARGRLRPRRAGRHRPRRRPAGPGEGAAPQGGHGDRPGHPAGPHPRQPRPARLAVRHLAQRRPGGQGQLPGRHGAGHRRPPGRAARQADPRAGLRAGRQVGAGRAAAPGRDGRGHRRRPLLGHHHAPGRGGAAERRRAAGPGGRQGAGRDGPPLAPRGRRGAHPRAAQPRRDPAGAAGAARRGRLDPRPGAHLRGAVAAGQGLHRPRRPGRGRPRRARRRDQPPVRHRRRAPARHHPRARRSSSGCWSRSG